MSIIKEREHLTGEINRTHRAGRRKKHVRNPAGYEEIRLVIATFSPADRYRIQRAGTILDSLNNSSCDSNEIYPNAIIDHQRTEVRKVFEVLDRHSKSLDFGLNKVRLIDENIHELGASIEIETDRNILIYVIITPDSEKIKGVHSKIRKIFSGGSESLYGLIAQNNLVVFRYAVGETDQSLLSRLLSDIRQVNRLKSSEN